MEFFRTFLKDLIQILTEPVRFYRERFFALSFAQALAFGVLVNWLASILEWLTRIVKHETLWDSVKRIQNQFSTLPIFKDVPETIWNQAGNSATPVSSPFALELGALIISPFQSLATFCVSGLFLFLGAMLFVPKESGSERDPLEVSIFIRLAAVSAAPALVGSILGFLPLNLGGAIGWIYHVAILIIGIGLRFRISYLRAGGIIFLPGIVLVLLLSCFVGMAFLALAKLSGMA
jgi:hypothetical protein